MGHIKMVSFRILKEVQTLLVVNVVGDVNLFNCYGTH